MHHDPLFLISANLFVAVLLRILKPNMLTAAFLGVVIVASAGFLGTRHAAEVMAAVNRGRNLFVHSTADPSGWPPERQRAYPDLELFDQDGNPTRLSEFKGKLILIEPIGMACPACVALAGGHRVGAFEGVQPQANLESIEEYARRFAHLRLDDPRIVNVQLILFNQQMTAPTVEDIQNWSAHFGLQRSKNQIVLAGTADMASGASRAIIPGFQLIDQDFLLRADSTGHQPQDDLYTELLPLLRKLLKEEDPAAVQ